MTEVALRPFQPDDLAAVSEWIHDIDATATAATWLEETLAEPRLAGPHARRERFTSAIILGGTTVGAVLLSIDSWPDRRSEIGFVVGAPWRQRGVATQAIELQVRQAFDDFGLHRVWAACDPDNRAAVAALTRCGFAVEGCLVDDRLVGEAWRDSLILGRIAQS